MENENQKNYRYYAFISYNHKDIAAAKWLQRKLENYRLPAVLQKQYENAPKKMKIFRDKTDLSAGKTVEKALENELALSKCLVVVCSPNIAYPDTEEKPNWVEREIKTFLSMGHSVEDIFPIIIDGQVKQGAENDCWTSTLHNMNKLAADITADGKRDAFIRLVAGLLDIKYDDIKQREKQRLIRKTALLSTVGVLTACLLFATIWFFAPHTKYYADYITRYSLPEGIPELELSRKEIKHRSAHYAITTRWGIFGFGNKPVKLEHKNAFGLIVPESSSTERQDKPQYAEFEYKNNLSLSKNKQEWELQTAKFKYDSANYFESGLIEGGHEILLSFSREKGETFVDFYYPTKDRVQKSLSNDFLSDTSIFYSDIPILNIESDDLEKSTGYNVESVFFENVSSIFRWKIKYFESDENKKGLDEKIEFFNKNYQPTSDKNGIKGYLCKYNDKNLLEEKSFIYAENDISIIDTVQYEYDDYNLTGLFFKCNNQYCNNESRHYSYKKIENDEKENSFKITSYDKNGNIYEFTKTIYDNNGMTIETETVSERFNFSMKTIESKKGLWDKIVTTYYDTNPKQEFYSCSEFEYNKDGSWRQTKEQVLDKDGNEIYQREYIITKTDEETILEIRTKINQKIKNSSFNIYDKYGRLIKDYYEENEYVASKSTVEYFGENRSLYYTDQNDLPKTSLFITTENGKLKLVKDFSRVDFSYDNNGNIVYVKFKDQLGNPAKSHHLGFSEYYATYNPQGLLINEIFYDENRNFSEDTIYGYAMFYAQTDYTGSYYISGFYLNGKKEFVNNPKKGYAYFNSTKTSNNSLITRFYDKDGNLVFEKETPLPEKAVIGNSAKKDVFEENNINYSYEIREENDNEKIHSFYDNNNDIVFRHTENNDGSFMTETFKSGKLSSKTIFYPGSPIPKEEYVYTEDGKKQYIYIYNEKGWIIKKIIFDENEQILEEYNFEYNANRTAKTQKLISNVDKTVTTAHFYENENPKSVKLESLDGKLIAEQEFDENGNIINQIVY